MYVVLRTMYKTVKIREIMLGDSIPFSMHENLSKYAGKSAKYAFQRTYTTHHALKSLSAYQAQIATQPN